MIIIVLRKFKKKTLTNNNVKTNENTNKEYSSSGPRRERKTAKMINIERKQSQRDTGHASRRKALNNKTHVDKKKKNNANDDNRNKNNKSQKKK